MMTTLAISDGTNYVMWGVNLLVSGAIAVILGRVATSQRKVERIEDDRDRRIQRMEDAATKREEAFDEHKLAMARSIDELATKLVDEKFRGFSHAIRNHVDGFASTLKEMTKELRESKDEFKELTQHDHKLELLLNGKVDQVKEYVRENTTNKKDMEKHEQSVDRKFSHLEESVGGMKQQLAVLIEKTNRKSS